MKLGINARFLLKDRLEGIGWFCHEVIRRMVARFPEHQFVLFFDRPFDPEFIYAGNVKGVVVQPPARHPVLWYLWFEYSLPAAMRRESVDLLISMDGFMSTRTSIPQYLVIHDLAYLHYPGQVSPAVRFFYRYFTGRYLNKAQKVFAVSEATRRDISTHFAIPEHQISVCYNGVRESFKPLQKKEAEEVRKQYSAGEEYFLFVGALHPRKNVHGLIRAFTMFKRNTNSPMFLLIIGRRAWQTQEIDEAYHESEYQSEIHFLDHISSAELSRLTGAASCAVAPSFLEGFGVPVLEALKCGIPVICSDCFSLPEVAGPGAVLFKPDDPASIASAMQEILREDLKSSRIQQGFQHALQFSWERTTEIICNQIVELNKK
ncbi:MAG: glycosyltransferase family 1 protein [Saprospiraceae bacterium]